MGNTCFSCINLKSNSNLSSTVDDETIIRNLGSGAKHFLKREMSYNLNTAPAQRTPAVRKETLFTMWGIDKDEILDESKNASVLGTLKSPDTQYNDMIGCRYGSHCDKGYVRDSMEDRLVIHQRNTLKDDTLCYLYGICDGHGGDKAAEYIQSNFHKTLFSLDKLLAEAPMKALKRAFTVTDEALLNYLERISPDSAHIDQSGTTACFFVSTGSKFYLAHVGDSVAILSERGKAKVLNSMHSPTDDIELNRIRKAGGEVIQGRIFRSLGVSRAFGDYHFKTSRGKYKKKFKGDIVSVIPDIHEIEITAKHEFLVLTSDGLTSVMNPREIVNFVKTGLLSHQNIQQVAEDLVIEATKNRNCSDNVSVIIIAFHQWSQVPSRNTSFAKRQRGSSSIPSDLSEISRRPGFLAEGLVDMDIPPQPKLIASSRGSSFSSLCPVEERKENFRNSNEISKKEGCTYGDYVNDNDRRNTCMGTSSAMMGMSLPPPPSMINGMASSAPPTVVLDSNRASINGRTESGSRRYSQLSSNEDLVRHSIVT